MFMVNVEDLEYNTYIIRMSVHNDVSLNKIDGNNNVSIYLTNNYWAINVSYGA